MTHNQVAQIIGKTGLWRCGDRSMDTNAIRVAVIVVDARKVFNRLDYRITPENGKG